MTRRRKLQYFIFHIIKYKRISKWVMSSVPSLAYRPGCAYDCFVNLSETLKCHNFLILHPILMKFSVLCLLHFVLFIRINFSLGWTCPVSVYSMSIFKFKPQHELFKTQLQNTEHKHDQRCTVQSRKFEADIRRLSLKSLLSKTNTRLNCV